jgi:hypothetical protein
MDLGLLRLLPPSDSLTELLLYVYRVSLFWGFSF